jgi:competence protein ComEC
MSWGGGIARRVTAGLARRPALSTATLFILGIFAHAALPHQPAVYGATIAGIATVAIVVRRRDWICTALIALGIFTSGAAIAQLEAFFYPTSEISAFAADAPHLAQLELKIDDVPRILTQPFESFHAMAPRQVTLAKAMRVRTWHGWEPTSGKLLVQIDQPHPRLAINQTVRVLGMIQRPGPAMNPGQFDWANYYREQRILVSLRIPHANNIAILTSPGPTMLDRLRQGARDMLAMGFPASRSLDHALLRALVLGDSDPQLRDVQEQFMRTGTSHHLAISGMHVAVLGGVIFFLCRLLKRPPRFAVWLAMGLVLIYGAVALPSPPVIRSVLLCVIFGIGILTRRSLDAVQLLALSVLAMLIYHPIDIYNAGFQLSFGTVLGLMLFTKPLMAKFARDDPDTEALRGLVRPTIGSRLLDTLKASFAAGFVAWIVSMPLIAHHFEQLNPWAIIASILLAPIVFAALIGGFLKVILTILLPGFSGTWASIAVIPVAGMRHSVDLLAKLPGSDVPFPSVAIALILMYYVAQSGAMFLQPRKRMRWCGQLAPVTCCVAFALVAQHAGVTRAPTFVARSMRVTVLAVGAGQCAVVEPERGPIALIDAGSSSLSDLQRKCLGPCLRHEQEQNIGTIILSHSDYDHISAAGEITSAYGVHDVILSPHFAHFAAVDPPATNLLDTLDRLDVHRHIVKQGEQFPIADANVEVLWPPAHCSMNSNNSGLVLKLHIAGKSILFPADIQEPAERELLNDPSKLKSDVLIAPHHGSSEDCTAAFLAAVHPSIIVSSNDRTLTAKQRRFDELAKGYALYRTNDYGAITITITADGQLSITPFLKKGTVQK